MKDYLKNIAKAGLTMFAVGALLALTAPLLAEGLLGTGLISAAQATQFAATSVAWTGAFFGAFGAIQAAVAPIIGKFFEPKKGAAMLTQPSISHTADASPAMSQAHSVAQAPSTHFQDMLAAQRAASTLNPGGKAVG